MTAPASPPVTVTVAVAVPTQDHPSMCTPNRPVSTATIADAPSSSLRAHGTFRRKSPYSSTPATRAPPAASPPAVSPQRSDSLFTTASSSPPAHSVFAPIRDGAGEAVCAPRDTTVVYVAASLPTSSFPDSVTLPFRSWTTLCAGPSAGERPGSPSSASFSSSPPDGLSSIVEACAGWRAPVCLDSHLPLAPPPSPSLLDVSPEIGCTVRATHTYSFSRPNACTGSRRASGCVDAPSSATTNVTTDVSDETVFDTSPSSPSVPFSVPHPKPISDPLSVSPSCSSSCCARAPECERSNCGVGSLDPAPVVEPPMAALDAHGSSRATIPLPPSPAPHPSDSIPCLMQPCKSVPALFAQNRTAPARPSRSLGNASPVVTTSPHHHSEYSGNVGAVVHENSGPPKPERQEVAATGSVSNPIFSLFRGAVPAMRSAAGLPPLSLSPAVDDAAVSRLFLSQCSALAVSFSHHHSRCFPAEPTPDSTAPMPSASSVTASHTIPTTSVAPATSTSADAGQADERSVISRPQRHRDTQSAAPPQPRPAPVAGPPPPPPPYQPPSDARSQQQHNPPLSTRPAPVPTHADARGPMLPPQPAPIRVGGIVLPQQPLVPGGTFPLPPGKAHYGPGGAPGPAMAHHPPVCQTLSAAVPSHVHGGQQYAPPPPYGAAIASAPVFFCVPAPTATTHAPTTLSSGGRRGKRGCRAGRQVKSRRPGSTKSEPDDEEEGSTGEDEAGPHSS